MELDKIYTIQDLQILQKITIDLVQENKTLTERVKELENKLNQHSQNSHKPPSSNPFKKEKNRTTTSLKKILGSGKEVKKVGGQHGHVGKSLEIIRVDEEQVLYPKNCPCCGKEATEQNKFYGKEVRYECELPKIELKVIKYIQGYINCCGQKHYGKFPVNVNSRIQYGSRVKALVSLLNNSFKMPLKKISELFETIFGQKINVSTMSSINDEMEVKLEPSIEVIKASLIESKTIHSDETSIRINAITHWVHVVCNSLWTWIYPHKQRGAEAMNSDHGILKKCKNNMVHDCWGSYFDFEDATHILCNAHLLRELQKLKEAGSQWAKQMIDFMLNIYAETKANPKDPTILTNKEDCYKKYVNICNIGLKEEPTPLKTGKRGRTKKSKGLNLLERMIKYKDGILAFAFDLDIPFTNNWAENDLRKVKIKQKVSQCFRTFKGAENYTTIESFISTLKKQKRNVWAEFIALFSQEKYCYNPVS